MFLVGHVQRNTIVGTNLFCYINESIQFKKIQYPIIMQSKLKLLATRNGSTTTKIRL